MSLERAELEARLAALRARNSIYVRYKCISWEQGQQYGMPIIPQEMGGIPFDRSGNSPEQ